MAELGETDDPRQLVPGEPGAVSTTARALRSRADALARAGIGLQRIDTTDGWSGPAGDAFRAKFRGVPGDWRQAARSFSTTADALDNYSATLTWAQQQAAQAITQWNAAQAVTAQVPFHDPGAAGRASAQSLLGAARSDLNEAATEVARVIGAERDKAPTKPSFWSRVKGLVSDTGAVLENTGAKVVNALASTGHAMIHHPGDVALAAAGALLAEAGVGGEVVGAGLDLTGGGALAGGPLGVVSAGAIVGGATVAGGAAGDLIMHARSDDSVSPASTDHAGAADSGSGITGDGGEMIGSKGTQITSKTLWSRGRFRIDVENPDPGGRDGQLHLQDQATRLKYIYNFKTGEFDGMPKSIQKLLDKKFPGYLSGIAKGRTALGE